ncbi:DUF1456 family protein [Planomicrobium sp. YIM 101495]|uniref:DUF1456 family protein n=1 Tax=Planomicrobium sp. YIM 101495 TaxID=2665160 RepID=UPI0012B8E986|nr:DUF1456 family protein [Planomicrobium sp. YIM 101495]MTD30603.1 DUF1456 family protein [Planomicrobium sp. YIM 101495]
MDNNDRLIRLRYALDLKDRDMLAIFKLGGMEMSRDEVQGVMTKSPESDEEVADDAGKHITADTSVYEAFLNGLVSYKRGKRDPLPGQPEFPEPTFEHPNNLLLKKVKIAMAMTGEDMLETFKAAKFIVSKGEISAFLRKEGQKNYKECGDQITRNFLKGLAVKNRK